MDMKKNPLSYSRMVAAIFVIATTVCPVALQTTFAKTTKDKSVKSTASVTQPGEQARVDPQTQESNQLVYRLIADRLVDEGKGFIVEKKQNLLFIDGKQQTIEIANKYLQNILQTDIKVQVFSFRERLQMHPGAGIMELITPVTTSAGCIQYKQPKKPGC
jgi:hypothetical protein